MAVEEHRLREIPPSMEKEQGFEFYFSIIRRRWAWFLVPFVGVLCVSIIVTLLMRPIYSSEARILVQSQQIPLELVRPTVTMTAEERIQVIAQRIMTRDNLLAIVDKFHMFPNWRSSMSDTDLVDLMRDRASITPVSLDLKGPAQRNASTVAFTVGFEYEDPQTTMRVANELVTLILNEDVHSRTSRASETTKFLAQEVDRLENERLAIEAKIAALSATSFGTQEASAQLATLKAELLQKSAIYSDSHPIIKALKEQINALEQAGVHALPQQPQDAATGADSPEAPLQGSTPVSTPKDVAPGNSSLSLLQENEKSIQDDLDKAREKLLTARQGQRLEEDQEAERFEVIEQPSLPQQPVKPNRKKMLAMGVALSIVAGFGGVFGIESWDKTLRGTADLPVPRRLVVTIPYISTREEIGRTKRRLKIAAVAAAVAFIAALALIHFLVVPLDLVFEKLTDSVIGA